MPNTLTVQTWDLVLPRPSWVLVTNPDRQLPCHFSKTVLRIPSILRDALLFLSGLFLQLFVDQPLQALGLFCCIGSGIDLHRLEVVAQPVLVERLDRDLCPVRHPQHGKLIGGQLLCQYGSFRSRTTPPSAPTLCAPTPRTGWSGRSARPSTCSAPQRSRGRCRCSSSTTSPAELSTVERKAVKKLAWIPASKFDRYTASLHSGTYPLDELDQSILNRYAHPITKDALLEAIAEFSRFYQDAFLSHFPQGHPVANIPDTPHLILGGGTGFLSKTVGYPYLKDDYAAVLFKSRCSDKQKSRHTNVCLLFLVGAAGFEPTASSSRTRRATNCAMPRKYRSRKATAVFWLGMRESNSHK